MQEISLVSVSVRDRFVIFILGHSFRRSGFLPLERLPLIRLLGGSQFRKFCVICMIILVITIWMTCTFHEEEERPATNNARQGSVAIRPI